MKSPEKIAQLRETQAKADAIREELGFRMRDEIIFSAALNAYSNDVVMVVANGLGGATTSVVEGNYPVDYVVKHEKFFPTEEEAASIAESLAFQGASPSIFLCDVGLSII
jgi:hypothetical protein